MKTMTSLLFLLFFSEQGIHGGLLYSFFIFTRQVNSKLGSNKGKESLICVRNTDEVGKNYIFLKTNFFRE